MFHRTLEQKQISNPLQILILHIMLKSASVIAGFTKQIVKNISLIEKSRTWIFLYLIKIAVFGMPFKLQDR